MHALRPLPPPFLLPAWSSHQLCQLSKVYDSSRNGFSACLASQTTSNRQSSTESSPDKLSRQRKLPQLLKPIRIVAFDPREEENSSGKPGSRNHPPAEEPKLDAGKNFVPLRFRKIRSGSGSSESPGTSQDEVRSNIDARTVKKLHPQEGLTVRRVVLESHRAGLEEQERPEVNTKTTHRGQSQEKEKKELGKSSAEGKTQWTDAGKATFDGYKARAWNTSASWDTSVVASRPKSQNSQMQESSVLQKQESSSLQEKRSSSSRKYGSSNSQKQMLHLDRGLPNEKNTKVTRNSESGLGRTLLDNSTEAKSNYSEITIDLQDSDSAAMGATPMPNNEELKLSLLEELFPVEAKRAKRMMVGLTGRKGPYKTEIDRLDPPEIEDSHNLDETAEDDTKARSSAATQTASQASMRADYLTVLVHYGANPDLADADYQRVIPRGTHIQEWRGPGDIVKGKTLFPSCIIPHS